MAWPKGKKRSPETIRLAAETRRKNRAARGWRGRTPRVGAETATVAAFAAEPTVPDMQRNPQSQRQHLRSLECQLASMIEAAIAIRRQVQQMAQEVEL